MGHPRRRVGSDIEGCRPVAAAERALFTRRRKEIYEALHPETKNGAAGNGREKVRQLGEATPADRFTADTARSTGQSERAIQRDAARGSIGDDLAAQDAQRGPYGGAGNCSSSSMGGVATIAKMGVPLLLPQPAAKSANRPACRVTSR